MSHHWSSTDCHSWSRHQERRHIQRLLPTRCVVCQAPATLCCVTHALVQCCDVHYQIHRRMAHQPKTNGGHIVSRTDPRRAPA